MRWKALAEIYKMRSFAPFSWDPAQFFVHESLNILLYLRAEFENFAK